MTGPAERPPGVAENFQAVPPITVVVVSWNTRDRLRSCLESLRHSVDRGDAEVWVVDNGSTDGSRGLVRNRYEWVKLIEPKHNLGFGPAVNLVAEKADGRWIAAANADIQLGADALELLLATGERDLRVGAVAPRLTLADGSTQHSVHRFPTLSLAISTGLGIPRLSPRLADRFCLEGRWNPDRARYVDWAHGAFLLLRRDAFDAIGGFDPRQWMYAEDIDIAWRLSQAGFKVRYEPAAIVDHAVSASTAQAFGKAGRSQRHIAASYAWMLRRQGLLVTWATALVNLVGAAVRLGLLAPLAPFGDNWNKRRLRAQRFLRLHRLGLRSRAKISGAA